MVLDAKSGHITTKWVLVAVAVGLVILGLLCATSGCCHGESGDDDVFTGHVTVVDDSDDSTSSSGMTTTSCCSGHSPRASSHDDADSQQTLAGAWDVARIHRLPTSYSAEPRHDIVRDVPYEGGEQV